MDRQRYSRRDGLDGCSRICRRRFRQRRMKVGLEMLGAGKGGGISGREATLRTLDTRKRTKTVVHCAGKGDGEGD
jgi:hypothetical protein